MCGIVGYVGDKQAFPILINGLKRLEYRGYDSAGTALCTQSGDLRIYKTQGKVAALEQYVASKSSEGTIGIAHTRWATHGAPNSINAHPHFSQNKELALVHNGIIENYREIKEDLINKGYTFHSETDTEVLVHLFEYTMQTHELDLFHAVQLALNNVIGAYAIAVIHKARPNTLVLARKSSPLIIGVGENNSEFFAGSDATPIVEHTRQVIYLDDNEVAELTPGKAPHIENISGAHCLHETSFISFDIGAIEKEGYNHFMLKEIHEQPKALQDCMRGRISLDNYKVVLSSIIDHANKILFANRIVIVACGTSWHAGLIAKQLIEDIAGIPVAVEYASEFRYRNPVILPSDLVIAISQSGETADTIAAIQLAKEKGAFTYGVCNSVGSTIARITDTGAYIHVGPEIGVASTKAFTGQVTVFVLFALAVAWERRNMPTERLEKIARELTNIPMLIEKTLQNNKNIEELAKRFANAANFLYLGRGYNYPVALEGALKLKELSYIHAQGYPAAEMKHGPIALVDDKMPIVVVATKDENYDKIISNIQELKARKGVVIAVVSEGDTQIAEFTDYQIEVPQTLPELEALLTVIPLQLLSYYIAVEKGCDVDQPRNLAKSVTVE